MGFILGREDNKGKGLLVMITDEIREELFAKQDKKYRDNPYRAINFSQDENGTLICPNGRKFHFKYEDIHFQHIH